MDSLSPNISLFLKQMDICTIVMENAFDNRLFPRGRT